METDRCYVNHDQPARIISFGNGKIERVLQYDPSHNKFSTLSFTAKTTGQNWSVGASREFRVSVQLGDTSADINNAWDQDQGDLTFRDHAVEDLEDGGKRLIIRLESSRVPARVRLIHEIHPACDWMKRRIGIENLGTEPLTVTRYEPETLRFPSGLVGFYLRSWRWGCGSFVDRDNDVGIGLQSFSMGGRATEPATVPTDSPLVITDANGKDFCWFYPEVPIQAVAVGAESQPHVGVRNIWDAVVAAGAIVDFSAGVILGAGWGSYPDAFRSFRSYLDEQVVKGKAENSPSPLVYNTWYSLGASDSEPSHKSCLPLIDASADLGVDMFVMDAGWHRHCGDWDEDRSKFPAGLAAISAYCHQKGLKFGLWADVRMACECGQVFKEHPEWRVQKPDGVFYTDNFLKHDITAMCLASEFGDRIKERLVQLVTDLKLDCLKIDNVCVLSHYSFWAECYAKEHRHPPGSSHKAIWEKWLEIMDAVKRAHPGILIESIPSGLSLLDKHDLVWVADYQYRPDWTREAYFYRAIFSQMAYTHPIAALHQGWPSTECEDLHQLDCLCASTIGIGIQCGVTGILDSTNTAQQAVLRKWIQWRQENKRYLGVYQHLFEDHPPVALETATDNIRMRSVALQWKPDAIDGFAHLLSDGGWIFLFNATNTVMSVSLVLRLSDFRISSFSVVTGFAEFAYHPESHTLRLEQTLTPGSYSRHRLFTEFPVSVKTIEDRILKVTWDEKTKDFVMVVQGQGGQRRACLLTNKLGAPSSSENCTIERVDLSTGVLTILYMLPGGMGGGLQGEFALRLHWA